MPIQLLKPEVSSRIAAGEVIERPASAVKELVENALDAGATRIQVEVRDGGVGYIRVSDDGCGIPADQVEIAFQRFATSKLSSASELETVETLGFRGEALPSIAAVARVEMQSRARDEGSGARIEIEDGETQSFDRAGAPVGTTVVVRNLFRNFPVRRKFLRTPSSELSRIQSVVTHYALAYPEVVFELRPDRGRTFISPGAGSLRDAVSAVHGRRVAEVMLELDQDEGEDRLLLVSGLVGPPSMDRANRTYISIFVNRRWITSRSLSFAIEQSYHGFMAERRFPVAVVHLNVPFDDVDVNTHPAKSEVRFKRENLAFGAVQRAVRRTLNEHAPVPEVSHGGITRPSGAAAQSSPTSFWPTTPFSPTQPAGGGPASPSSGPDYLDILDPPEPGPRDESLTPRETLPILRVLGQVQNTYVVAEGPNGLYMIDQHAAHERVMFETVISRSADGQSEVQSLLEPAVIELDAERMEMVQTHSDLIGSTGFAIEPFGETAVLVRGVPALLGQSDEGQALIDVLDLMADGGGFETWEERAAYSIACHGAIRAGKVMSRDEMQELVRQLEACAQPNSCPHGRPTMIHMSSGQLEREFGRPPTAP